MIALKRDSDKLLNDLFKKGKPQDIRSLALLLSKWASKSKDDEKFQLVYLSECMASVTSFDDFILDLKFHTIREIYTAYSELLTEYLENDIITKQMIMETDELDTVPWRIYHAIVKRMTTIEKLFKQHKHDL